MNKITCLLNICTFIYIYMQTTSGTTDQGYLNLVSTWSLISEKSVGDTGQLCLFSSLLLPLFESGPSDRCRYGCLISWYGNSDPIGMAPGPGRHGGPLSSLSHQKMKTPHSISYRTAQDSCSFMKWCLWILPPWAALTRLCVLPLFTSHGPELQMGNFVWTCVCTAHHH